VKTYDLDIAAKVFCAVFAMMTLIACACRPYDVVLF